MTKKFKIFILLFLIVGLFFLPTNNKPINASTSTNVKKVIKTAYKKKGTGYYKIGKCTGFVCYTMRHSKAKLKVKFPKNGYVSTLKRKMRKCKVKKPRKGDVVAYGNSHVAIYIGKGKIIHASSSRRRVIVANMKCVGGHRTYYRVVK